jgi:predicted NACHT family NTPase
MARRSLRASPEGIKRGETALTTHKLTHERLAHELQITRQPVSQFFTRQPVKSEIFVNICHRLKLDWQEIAELDIDALVQEVRQACHDKIQMLYGKMQLLDISQPVDIDNLYVDVNILEEIVSQQWRELSDLLRGFNPAADDFDRLGLGKVRQKRVSGLKAVTEHSRLMVLGKPGAGKTTFLKHIAIECNKGEFQANRIPIFIPLKIFAEEARSADDFRILQYIHKEFTSCGITDQSRTEEVLRQGRGLILLDGLDEVPEEYSDEVVKQISSFAGNYFNNRFIITCRIGAIKYKFLYDGFTEVEVADFNEKQIEYFANNWFVAFSKKNQEKGLVLASQFMEKLKLPENKQIRELAVTPILLNLTCLVFQVRAIFPQNAPSCMSKDWTFSSEDGMKPRVFNGMTFIAIWM